MRFSGTFRRPQLDLARYRAALDKRLTQAIIEAAQIWLNATVVSLIPIWSGASAATFMRLAAAAKANFLLSPSPVAGAPNRVGLGRAHSQGGLSLGVHQGEYLFEYGTSLEHLIENEFKAIPRLKRPGPYRFQEAGVNAFQQYARKVRLPNPYKFLTVKTIKVR
jgi:hypothetical protein